MHRQMSCPSDLIYEEENVEDHVHSTSCENETVGGRTKLQLVKSDRARRLATGLGAVRKVDSAPILGLASYPPAAFWSENIL